MRGSEIFEIDRPSDTALLFCFGRRVPLEAYLEVRGNPNPQPSPPAVMEAYPSLRTVVVIGDTAGEVHSQPDPNPPSQVCAP